jgi:hypothetical protein
MAAFPSMLTRTSARAPGAVQRSAAASRVAVAHRVRNGVVETPVI